MEKQLALLQGQIEAAETELVEREAELVDLRVELYAFQLEYDTQVGRSIAELEEVEAEIERCRRLISQHRQWEPGSSSRTGSSPAYIPVEEQYRRIWQQPPEEPPFTPPDEPVDPATEAQIKKLYRQLCRRFHPDLARGEAERAWRTDVMTAINAAYAARDLGELQALAEKPDRSPAPETGTDEQRLAALSDRLRQIQRRLQEVEREIRELTDSEMVQLSLDVKLARWEGRDLLAEIAAGVKQDLAQKRAELDLSTAQLRRLGIEGSEP